METTELAPFRLWTERGTWRGVTATLTLNFIDTPGGSRVRAEGEVSGSGAVGGARLGRRPAGSTAIGADLRKAAPILGERASRLKALRGRTGDGRHDR